MTSKNFNNSDFSTTLLTHLLPSSKTNMNFHPVTQPIPVLMNSLHFKVLLLHLLLFVFYINFFVRNLNCRSIGD